MNFVRKKIRLNLFSYRFRYTIAVIIMPDWVRKMAEIPWKLKSSWIDEKTTMNYQAVKAIYEIRNRMLWLSLNL